MKKLMIILVLSLLLTTILVAKAPQVKEMNPVDVSDVTTRSRGETIVYQETFENGLGTWTGVDGSMNPPHNWHLTSNPNFLHGGSGYSWWMGSTNYGTIGGYTDATFIYLQTPAITVPTANPTLTFDVNFHLEAPDTYQGYDGWDAANVRISTNGGTTWTVITPTTPAYNCNSMFGFGYNGEGTGVPGWGGSSGGWVPASFNLSSYAGQSVLIRWLFGSDPAHSTMDEPALWGIVIDNISLGSFAHNFNDGNTQGMTWGSARKEGGQLWKIGTHASAPSPTHVALCQNDAGTYNPFMLNYLVSDYYMLPPDGDIRVDFMVRGNIPQGTDSTDNTVMGFELTLDGYNWYAMSNPYGDPEGNNYIYTIGDGGNCPNWTISTTAFSGQDGYISGYAGQQVKFRIMLRTGSATPTTEGVMIDNFTIYHKRLLIGPKDLTASTTGTSVTLNWRNPFNYGDPEPGWLTHAEGDEYNDAIGWTSNDGSPLTSVTVAHRFNSIQLVEKQVVGGYLKKIAFMPNEFNPNTTYEVRVWTGGNGVSSPGTLVAQKAYVGPITSQAWHEVTLDTPIEITLEEELRFGYFSDNIQGATQGTTLYAPAVDASEGLNGFGNIYHLSGWGTLSGGTGGNWLIKAYIEGADGQPIILGSTDTETRTLDMPTGFRVYRGANATTFTAIGETNAETTTYTDNTPNVGEISFYTVAALYDEDEAENRTNIVAAFVPTSDTIIKSVDDGTSEMAYVQSGNLTYQLVNPFTHNSAYKVTHVAFYIEGLSTGTILLKLFEENEDGLPGTEFHSQSVAGTGFVSGWNFIKLTESVNLTRPAGGFFAGFQLTTASPKLGIDTSSTGNTLYRTGSTSQLPNLPWNPLTHVPGTAMIRAYIINANSEGDELFPIEKFAATNYPNPFNPETTISFNMPTKGNATVQIYNIKGQLVNTLLNDEVNAGTTSVVWKGFDSTGKQVTSGVYFYRIKTDTETIVNKMLLMK